MLDGLYDAQLKDDHNHFHKELPAWCPTTTQESSRDDDAITDSSTFRGSTGVHSPSPTPLRSPTNEQSRRRRSSLSPRVVHAASINNNPPMSPHATTTTTPQVSLPSAPTIKRTLYLIRHGESLTNVAGACQHKFDPSLSPNGQSQCTDLSLRFDEAPSPTPTTTAHSCSGSVDWSSLRMPHVAFTSPLTRALETATLIFGPPAGGVPSTTPTTDVVCLEDLREVVGENAIAERRRAICDLSRQFPSVDFGCLQTNEDPFTVSSAPHHHLHAADYDAEVHRLTQETSRGAGVRESSKCLRERAAKMLYFLLHLPPQVPPSSSGGAEEPTPHAIVSHFHFLNFLVERLVCASHIDKDSNASSDVCGDLLTATDRWSKKWPNTGLVKVTLTIALPTNGSPASLSHVEFQPMFTPIAN